MEIAIIILSLSLAGSVFYILRQHNNIQNLIKIKAESEGNIKLLEHKLQEFQEVDKVKEEIFSATKAAMFESGSEIFKKEGEAFSKKTLDELAKVLQNLNILKGRVEHSETRLEGIWKSFASPGATGRFTELSLENTLKHFGLVSGKDFIMQYSSSGGKRPDAVIFLPNNRRIIIDCKASSYFLELAISKDDYSRINAEKKIKTSMYDHVKGLSSKAYKESIEELKQGEHIYTVMFLGSESAIEIIHEIDPEFRDRCAKEDIILAGPSGLAAILSLARFMVTKEQQAKHFDEIITHVTSLLGNLKEVVEHADKFGKSLSKVVEYYQLFTNVINNKLLPKGRTIARLGVSLPKNQELPKDINYLEDKQETEIISEKKIA